MSTDLLPGVPTGTPPLLPQPRSERFNVIRVWLADESFTDIIILSTWNWQMISDWLGTGKGGLFQKWWFLCLNVGLSIGLYPMSARLPPCPFIAKHVHASFPPLTSTNIVRIAYLDLLKPMTIVDKAIKHHPHHEQENSHLNPWPQSRSVHSA
jgi:hypothetical protein